MSFLSSRPRYLRLTLLGVLITAALSGALLYVAGPTPTDEPAAIAADVEGR